MSGPNCEECASCYHWVDYEGGECRIEQVFTNHNSSDWCGRYLSELVTCSECQGYGYGINDKETDCEYCDGSGEVTRDRS